MPVNVRWVTINGTQQIRVRLPGGQAVTLAESDAWQLMYDLETALLTKPLPWPDNGQCET